MITKTDITEILGREVDPIEDIQRVFRSSYSVYSDPKDGEFISDDYADVIDLTTQSGKLNDKEVKKLNKAVEHLNDVYTTIEQRLGRAGLLDEYNQVAEQINAINLADSNRSGVELMYAGPPLDDSAIELALA